MTEQERTGQLLAADSFRVRGIGARAEVRGWGLHAERFARTAADCLEDPTERVWLANAMPEFLAHARKEIAAFGDGFPRIELWRRQGGTLQLHVATRPLPQLTEQLALRTARGIELTHPQRKGPNIEYLAALNRELGAEALLLDARGNICEGATTSIVWWEDDTLCRVAGLERVWSITERQLVDIAHGLGTEVASRDLPSTELCLHEAWAVNALHGIRPVRAVDNVPLPQPHTERLATYRRALDLLWSPILTQ